ncbi:MAG: DinB family protein [Acidobacteriota bacterium]
MAKQSSTAKVIAAWRRLPDVIEAAIEGLTRRDLDLRGGSDEWSTRETLHHLVEANLVASTMVIAALGKSGCTYDWSWLNPDKAWMKRMGYDSAPIQPAIELLRAVSRHVSTLISLNSDAGRREVKLFDAPGAKKYAMTVEQILQQEVEHAHQHLRDVQATREGARGQTR